MMGLISKRARAYRALFDPTGERQIDVGIVLADLARFCNVNKPSIRLAGDAVDPLATMVAEGRREVFLRIMAYANVTPDQIRNMKESDDE